MKQLKFSYLKGMTTKSQEELIEAFDEIVIAVNGCTITEGEGADKHSLGTLLFYAIRKYIQSNRINIDFGEYFQKRRHICQPHFTFVEVDAVIKEALLNKYPVDIETKQYLVDDKSITKLWTKFKSIQSFNRNSASDYSKYLSMRAKGGESGTYVDDEVIINIWKNVRQAAIDVNARKVLVTISSKCIKYVSTF